MPLRANTSGVPSGATLVAVGKQAGLDVTLTAEGLPEVLRDLDNLDDMVLDEMYITMRRAVDTLEQALVQRTPVNSGALRGAWSTDVERGVSAVKGTVANPLPYADVMDKGRRPGQKWPPRDAIALWVKRKIGISEPREIERVAYLIQRKIGIKGIEGRHFVRDSVDTVRPIINADFDGIPERLARRVERE